MNWLNRLERMFRFREQRLPREVDARLQLYEMERRVRMARYAATWRKKWAEQGLALERTRWRLWRVK